MQQTLDYQSTAARYHVAVEEKSDRTVISLPMPRAFEWQAFAVWGWVYLAK